MEKYICLDIRQKRWRMLFNPYILVKKVPYNTQQDKQRKSLCWEFQHIVSSSNKTLTELS